MASDRAGAAQVGRLQTHDRILMFGVKEARVVKNEKMIDRGAIYQTGPAASPSYVYWHKITLVWDEFTDSPEFAICYPGDRFLTIRD